MSRLADEAWAAMTHLIMESRWDWRKRVSDEVGLPFSRVRVLRRLESGALTMQGLAEAAMTDAPAATVAVNDLEGRGLVVRTINPDNRRVRLVEITREGLRVLERVDAVPNPAPRGIAALDDAELAQLMAILEHVSERERAPLAPRVAQ